MKRINFVKFALDLMMGITFALLYNTRVLGGMRFHEIAGLAVGFAVLVHILLNWKWVKNVTLSIFKKKITLKTRIGYILNMLLLLDMAAIITSGIFISRDLFPGINMQSSIFNQRTHIAASFLALALIGIHIGLHWKWVMNVFKRIIKTNKASKILGYAAKAAAVVVLAFGIYSMVSVNYFSNTVGIFGIGSSVAMEHNRGMKPDFKFQDETENGSGTADAQDVKPDFEPSGKGMRNGKGTGSSNILGVLAKYLSIMGVFTVLIYYIEKLLMRIKTSKALTVRQ